MTHPTEDTLTAYALGLLADRQSQELTEHFATCSVCDRLLGEYREMAAALHEWREASEQMVAAAQDAIVQRMRLHRLFHQLLTNQDLRRRAGEDPARVLAAHGIAPTPALLAAFKDLGTAGSERFPGELDERLSKFRRLLEWFPGAPPPLGN
jgi:anti-sigma factor RsiW